MMQTKNNKYVDPFSCLCCAKKIVTTTDDKGTKHIKIYICSKCEYPFCFYCMYRSGARTIHSHEMCKACISEEPIGLRDAELMYDTFKRGCCNYRIRVHCVTLKLKLQEVLDKKKEIEKQRDFLSGLKEIQLDCKELGIDIDNI